MFHQVPDKESHNNSKSSSKARRRRKKKASANQKNAKKDIKLKNHKLFSTMSTWAENFAVAATWQLKHQIAYWKAKAQALEYENKILHDIIRQSNYDDDAKDLQNDHTIVHSEMEHQEDSAEEDVVNNGDGQEDNDFEVSEEFIQFLAANAKYKEDAKRERERLRAKVEEEKTLKQEPRETTEDRQSQSKCLYGKHWQRVSALEIALQSQFIHDVDKDKPMYWPNIPLNL